MDWRELTPGRELDRVVAEQMGWTDIDDELIELGNLLGFPPGSSNCENVPNFSTITDDALLLLTGLWWQLESHSQEMVVCYICDHFTESLWERASAIQPTAAHAICHARLEWLTSKRGK